MSTFTIIGLGFIADKHLAAINNIGGEILAGCDIDEAKSHKVNIFYTDWERMLDKVTSDYVVICTPNHLHFQMALKALELGRKVILEKPAVLKKEELDVLEKYSDRVFNIFQLRFNKELIERKRNITDKHYNAEFAVCVHRDDWYYDSWKNKKEESGGLMFNIGVHYFDLLCWFFGEPKSWTLDESTDRRAKGTIKFNNCDAKWILTIDQPHDNQFRYMKIDGEQINLSQGFENLHTKIYEEAEKGINIKTEELRSVINLLTSLNN